MNKYIFLCILLNFDIFFIPLAIIIKEYLNTRNNEGHNTSGILDFLTIIVFPC